MDTRKEKDPTVVEQRDNAASGKPAARKVNRRFRWAWSALAAIFVLYWAQALWGISGQFVWGNYGYHAGYHGINARTLLRYGVFTPAHYTGRSPPPRSSYYLHHPVLAYQYLVPGLLIFGEQEWVIRLVPATFTFLALLALFWMVRRLWNEWAAVLASAVFVILPQNLTFCHLIDQQTPPLFYMILASGAFVLWFKDGGWKMGAVTLAGLAGACLGDWPPFVFAFMLALFAWGQLTASVRVAGRYDSYLPRGVAGTAAMALTCVALYFIVDRYLNFSLRIELFLILCAALALSAVPQEGPLPKKLGLDARWWRFALLCAVVVAVFAFHFIYTWKVGRMEDLKVAWKVRTGGALNPLFFKNYYRYILKLFFTKPLLILGAIWLVLTLVRAVAGTLKPRSVIPIAFLAAQFLHNMKFPNEINIHNYRGYYYAAVFPLAAADLAVFVYERIKATGLHDRLSGLFEGKEWRWPQLASMKLPAVTVAALSVVLLVCEARAAWPVLRDSRRLGGTLSFKRYRHYRHMIRFFKQVKHITRPDTFVLHHRGLRPRFEALWYLDRDNAKTHYLPRSAEAARRSAGHAYWRPRLSKKKRRRFRGRPWKGNVVVLADITNRRLKRPLEALLSKYPARIYWPFVCIYYRPGGPDLKAYRFAARPLGRFHSYLNWRPVELFFRRDVRLEKKWSTKK